MLIGRKNETLESINNSIQQNVSRWGVSNEMNEKIMTNIVTLTLTGGQKVGTRRGHKMFRRIRTNIGRKG